jgi:hypothetical protein
MGEPAQVVDWYRADSSARMVRILVTGASTMVVGGLVVAVSFLTRQPERVREYAAASGLLLVAMSAAFTQIMMHRLLRDDVSLEIRTDGLCFHARGTETLIAWAELASVRWDATPGTLVVERAGAEPVVVAWVPARISGPGLAAQVEHARQRAAMGLLRTQ